jgi:hypothetical protein
MDTITITNLDSIDFNSISSMNYPSATYNYTNNYGTISVGQGISNVTAFPSLTTAQISTLTVDTSSFKIHIPEDWINQFPDFYRVQKMCDEYPGLKIAFEKFKTVYKLVKDHYDTPEDQRPKP